MALFGTTKKETKAKPVKTKAVSKAKAGERNIPARDFSWVILRPRITEKATLLSEKGIYAFEISPRATKGDVSFAVQSLYKVIPRKVNIVKTPATSKPSRRGGLMRVAGNIKAYVFLKKGDTISLA